MIHELKILPQYFEAVQAGLKNFEIRKDDRNFKEGDTLVLKEYKMFNDGVVKGYGMYTGEEIEKEISYVLKGGQYGLEEGYCIASLKQEGIILRNIDLTGISQKEQFDKYLEEEGEFRTAYIDYKFTNSEEHKQHLIEEYFDLLQSSLGLIQKLGISAEEVMKEYPKHLEKIKLRPRKRE